MSLTLGNGPLSAHPGGAFNFSLSDAPKHRIFFQDFPRRLRAVAGGRVLFDTEGARLLHETAIPPVPYIPLADFDAELLSRTDHTTHCPFKGDASYWTITAGEQRIENAVWAYEAPREPAAWLDGYAAVYWDRMDAWFVEEEAVFGHLRDPFHRVDVLESSRPAVVRAAGVEVARSARPKLVFETGLPARVYVPRADVIPGALVPAERTAICPYKGRSSYWDVLAGDARIADGAWSYEAPLSEAAKAAGHVSFDGEGIEVELGAPSAQLPGA